MNGGQYGRAHSGGDSAATREAARQQQVLCTGFGLVGLAVVGAAVIGWVALGAFAPVVAIVGLAAVVAALVAAHRPVLIPVLVRSDAERAPRG